MASPTLLRSAQCWSCARSVTSALENSFQFTSRQQVRGLKKDAGTATTRVLLLRDITRYGAKGSIVKVPTGTMRNYWYPQKMADYLTKEKCEDLGVKMDAALERDSTFPSWKQRKVAKKQQRLDAEEQAELQAKSEEKRASKELLSSMSVLEEANVLEVKQLSPDESTSILDRLLPPNLEFYRTPVSLPQVEERISPSVPRSSTVSAAARAGKEAPAPTKASIYGSVSTNDIATNLKAILAEDTQGARVVLTPEEITFVQQMEEKDRVKQLGVFEVEIRLKGAADIVRRTIQVHAQG